MEVWEITDPHLFYEKLEDWLKKINAELVALKARSGMPVHFGRSGDSVNLDLDLVFEKLEAVWTQLYRLRVFGNETFADLKRNVQRAWQDLSASVLQCSELSQRLSFILVK